MKTETLTITRTKTITTTRMMTATLALALANAMAFAAIPLQDRPIMNVAAQCPLQDVEFVDSCGAEKFRSAHVHCGRIELDLMIENKKGTCFSTSELEEQAALVCQEECLVQAESGDLPAAQE